MEPQQVEYVKTIRRRKKHIFREKELKRNREEENNWKVLLRDGE
jgi:hypothetical protein